LIREPLCLIDPQIGGLKPTNLAAKQNEVPAGEAATRPVRRVGFRPPSSRTTDGGGSRAGFTFQA